MFRHAARRVIASPASAALRAAGATTVSAPRACPTLAARPLSTALTTPPASSIGGPGAIDDLGTKDGYFEKDRLPKGDPGKREFTYFMLGMGRFVYASSFRLILLKFLGTWCLSADVLAQAQGEYDLSEIEMGKTMTVMWRGKPVCIKRRTPEMIAAERAVQPDDLRDLETDEERCLKPEFVVVIGVCTHLGCVPSNDMGNYNGWYCPCHGSHYDTSGRIRLGPAPLNMEIPPYKFIERRVIVIG